MAPKVNFNAEEPAREEKQDEKQDEAHLQPERSKKSYSSMLCHSKDEDADNQSTAPKNIHEAAERGNTGFIVRLIERSLDFNINQKDNLGRTALHWAAELNRVQAAEALLDYGIDITIPESNGRTAVHLAARAGHTDMLQTIMEGISQEQKEAMINQPDQFGITPVYLALQKGNANNAAFEWLMDNGGKYNAS
uniref:Uncharacterized protein n=1 Tax=Dunaliella tertiolecta TaxID=3047 RepID=A0A7S3QTA9_DUNTE|mmetsp:Transcript_1185/g.2838  ORF Transcript_1185/g.2838 Transcript_1185/m.2838 type:complete len:193 (-) Transcript_1185:1223-1801(-)|eukprot:CAMPEP_0202346548 /NCGR_PEP_ID=MMETSP1126-20121109/5289_1 /ASSEMBLY_ACC=CAM_ASM_000457 /TAXON_ID=3047 /ORGANISM="Dunaliella tertiolecta, Strain CCMP1320" /LENGTH=192 /DNA_ID=CAMNT_0048937967 /DNA_START=57 /DNA_END=635 /DNA_ORIENTATION=-